VGVIINNNELVIYNAELLGKSYARIECKG